MDRIYPNDRVICRAKVKARQFNRCIRENKIDSMLASINSYMGICKITNGYNQARSIIRLLSRKWYEYVDFDRSRVCLTAKPEYKINNRIIRKFYETV